MHQTRIFPEGSIFHICNKSIANYQIFGNQTITLRFLHALDYYRNKQIRVSLSDFTKNRPYQFENLLIPKNGSVKFISYCIMPDHYHLLIKVLKENCLSHYVNNIENSFSRYFNLKNHRKGPLWQSRFRAVLIESNEQLLHVTRYIHLNPVTGNLVEKPEEWLYSSYRDYITEPKFLEEILHEISIKNQIHYKKFVEDNKDYQRRLQSIKKLLLD